MTTATAVGYLVADVLAETGVSESYLAFLVRTGVVRPGKARNGRTNVFSPAELERVRWAMDFRGRLTVEEMLAAPRPVGDGQ
jgi:DNA-binding transcriptional MerR regulator